MQVRIRIVLVVFSLLFLGLILRLGYWQIVMGGSLSKKAQGQYNSSAIKKAPRGNILASDGSFWVLRNTLWQISANPKLITETPSKVANKLAPFLAPENSEKSILSEFTLRVEKALSRENTSWVLVANKIDDMVKKNIEAMGIAGLNFEEQGGRYYPEASAAAQLLGFVGKDDAGDDIGYFGLEGYYNLPLSGKPGFVSAQKDARGVPILLGGNKEVDAINGIDLITTIDKRIQLLIERNLAEGVAKYGAIGGSITIMEPASGRILGLASLPSFDPRTYTTYSNEVFKNPVISDTFEPGSIIKPIVMAAALDGGFITPETKCDICTGPLNVDGYQIKTWNNKYNPDATMTDVIIHSDNIGMSFVGGRLGADRLYDYYQKFGIGLQTGIDLQGEASPGLRKKGTWSNVDLYTATFGQGVAVTGIQMVRAIAVLANGGLLPNPHVVEKIRGDGWEVDQSKTSSTRVISNEAAQKAATMMLNAANLGESKWAKVPGFNNIAAKTGTAQIPVAGHYDPTKTNHSFIGFAPVGNPKFVMLVTLNSPESSPWAAETAAPLWYSIARELFIYLGVQPGQR